MSSLTNMEFLTDLELMEKLRNGDEEAFECLLKRYEPFVKRIAKRYFACGFDWEDFYQIGAMAFFNAVMTYSEDKNASFYTYALSCIRNRIVSQYRKLSMKTEYALSEEKLMFVMDARESYSVTPIPTSSDTSEEEEERKVNEKRLEKMVARAKLSRLERACLNEYLMGKSYEEIGKELELSEKQVDQALYRCRKKVKEHGVTDLWFARE